MPKVRPRGVAVPQPDRGRRREFDSWMHQLEEHLYVAVLEPGEAAPYLLDIPPRVHSEVRYWAAIGKMRSTPVAVRTRWTTIVSPFRSITTANGSYSCIPIGFFLQRVIQGTVGASPESRFEATPSSPNALRCAVVRRSGRSKKHGATPSHAR